MCDYLREIVWQRSKVNLIWNKCVAPAMARPCRPENRQHFLDVGSTQGQVILKKIKTKKKPFPERNKKHFPGHVDTRPGGGLTGSAAFDFIVRRGDDTHAASLSSAFSEGGGLSFFSILLWEGGVEWRMRRRAIWACFLCLASLSLTKPSCTWLTGTPDSLAASSVAAFDVSSFLKLRYCFSCWASSIFIVFAAPHLCLLLPSFLLTWGA